MSMAIVAVGVSVVTAGFQVKAGMDAKKAAKKASALKNTETALLYDQKAVETENFVADQTSLFAKSGVLLKGSPLDVLEATRKEGLRQQEAILETGKAQASLINQQGKTAFLNSVGGAVGTVGSGLLQANSISNANKLNAAKIKSLETGG